MEQPAAPHARVWRTVRPVDLWLCAGVAAAGLAAALLDAPGWLRVPLGLAFVLACPGYAFVAALYPERHVEGEEGGAGRRGLRPLERAALSLGLSIAVVPLLGLALNYTPWGIRLAPVLGTVAAFTASCLAVAAWRRRRLPEDERLELRVEWASVPWRQRSPLDKALGVALVLSVLFAAGALVYVLATPREGERFTEFYILGPMGMASCYPQTFVEGAYRPSPSETDCPLEGGNVTVGVANHEGRTTTYWVRMVWTEEERQPDNTTRVLRAWEGRQWDITLGHRKVDLSLDAAFTPQHEENVDLPAPPAPGRLRLSFQLFRDAPPPPLPAATELPADFLEQPYRRLHLWIEQPAA